MYIYIYTYIHISIDIYIYIYIYREREREIHIHTELLSQRGPAEPASRDRGRPCRPSPRLLGRGRIFIVTLLL